MTNSDSKIIEQLVSRGATIEQANGYVKLVRQFERDSNGKGELHHILPRNSGWWKRFENMKWNHARVEWHLHIALHSYLCYIFPLNDQLVAAVRAATMRRHESKKKAQNKDRVISWYSEGRTADWIAVRVGTDPSLIIGWLRSWDVPIRASGDSRYYGKRLKHKAKIILWYSRGKPSTWIAAKIKGVTQDTIRAWLRTWGIKIRRTHEYFISPKKSKYKNEVLQWRQRGKSFRQIAHRLKVSPSTIRGWFESWRCAGDLNQKSHVGE